MRSLPYTLSGFAFLVLLGTSGCAEKSNEVEISGEITIDGEPINQGTITLVASDGEAPTGGGVIKDGTYTARVEPGPKTVLVLGNKLVGQEPMYKDMPDSPMREKYEMITPEAYNAAHLSPLSVTISEPDQNLNFDLDKSLKMSKRLRNQINR